MNKPMKRLMAAGGGMVLAGLALTVISVSLGGNFGAFDIEEKIPYIGDFFEFGSEDYLQEGTAQEGDFSDAQPISVENVRSIKFKAENCKVEIVAGDSGQTAATLLLSGNFTEKNLKDSFDDKNGLWELELKAKKHHNSEGYEAKLIVPPQLLEFELETNTGSAVVEGISANKLELKSNMAELELDSISANESSFEINMGDLTGSASLTGKVEIECTMGDVNLHLNNKTEYGYKIKNEMGSISIDGRNYEGMDNKAELNPDAPLFFDVECSMGDVSVEF